MHVALRPGQATDALAAALAEEGGFDVRVEGTGLLVDADRDGFLAALDEVGLGGVRMRGRIQVVPDGSFDGATLRYTRGGWVDLALGGYGSFSVQDGRLVAWVPREDVWGPLARALGGRDGRVPLASVAHEGPVPTEVLAVRDDGRTTRLGWAPPPARPTVETLRHDLAALGVVQGDALMVHAALRHVGADVHDLLEALEGAVGRDGALLVLLCAEPDRPFDTSSPAWSDLGVLPEAARTRAGWVCNAHPVARFAAWGAGARALVDDPPFDRYYGPGSPLARLVERGGAVVRLGSDRNTTTLFHYAEYVADLPEARTCVQEVLVAGPEGPALVRTVGLDDEHGILPGDADYFPDLLEAARARPDARAGRVGNAMSDRLDARSAVAAAVAWLRAAAVR
ncbi:MAG: AAC(3) family N-acetyltransferase [Alphaproteobacteria bacterium]|nr:AAC(3) family N-acetyltransferase [Alphaproteobacteria bacterium]